MIINMNSTNKKNKPGNSVQKAVSYFLADRNHKGEARPFSPVIVEGDPQAFLNTVQNGNHRGRYTSGDLTFMEPLSKLDPKVLSEIRISHKDASFPGIDSNRIASLRVGHGSQSSYDEHFAYGMEDLESGYQINGYLAYVYRDGRKVDIDFERMDAWGDMINAFYDLADPKDPLYQKGAALSSRKKWPKQTQELVDTINEFLTEKVIQGEVKNRKDVIDELKKLGMEVSRETKQSISIKNPDKPEGRSIRLTGEFFQRTYRANASKSYEARKRASDDFRARRWERYETAKAKFDRLYEIKSKFNQERYGVNGEKAPENRARKKRKAKRVYNGSGHRIGRMLDSYLWGSKDQSHTIAENLFGGEPIHTVPRSWQGYPFKKSTMPTNFRRKNSRNKKKEYINGTKQPVKSRTSQHLDKYIERKRESDEAFERTFRVHRESFERISDVATGATESVKESIEYVREATQQFQKLIEQDNRFRRKTEYNSETDRKIDRNLTQLTMGKDDYGKSKHKGDSYTP